MKKVYVSLIADLLHAGHIKILKKAEELGRVTVGLLESSAINQLNETAYLKYTQRLEVLNNLKMFHEVISQSYASYKEINKLTFIHVKCSLDQETPRPPLKAVKVNKFS